MECPLYISNYIKRALYGKQNIEGLKLTFYILKVKFKAFLVLGLVAGHFVP